LFTVLEKLWRYWLFRASNARKYALVFWNAMNFAMLWFSLSLLSISKLAKAGRGCIENSTIDFNLGLVTG